MTSPGESNQFDVARGQVLSHTWDTARPAAEVAAGIAGALVAAALAAAKGRQESRMAVRRTCRGVMSGLIASNKEHHLPETAVSLLKTMAGLSNRFNFLPADLMTWCMEGIADITMVAGGESGPAIQKRIQSEFMGVDGIFKEFCQKAIAKNWWTK